MRNVAFVAALVVGCALTGCASAEEATPTMTPTPWPPPTTPETAAVPNSSTESTLTWSEELSDEEALQLGVAAFLHFWTLTAEVMDKGFDDGALMDAATGDALAGAQETIEQAAQQDWSVTGLPLARNEELVSRLETENGESIQIALCGDMSDVVALDEDGVPVRPADADTAATVLVTIRVDGGKARFAGMDKLEDRDLCY